MTFPRNRVLTHVAATLLGAVVLTTGALDAHVGPTRTGVIHACAAKSGGAVRIVGAQATCRSTEKPVDWRSASDPSGPQVIGGGTGPTNADNGDLIGAFEPEVCTSANELDCDQFAGTDAGRPLAGTMANLSAQGGSIQRPETSASAGIRVRKNGSETILFCLVTTGNTSCQNTTNSVTFGVGDVFSIQVEGSPTPTTWRWTATFDPA